MNTNDETTNTKAQEAQEEKKKTSKSEGRSVWTIIKESTIEGVTHAVMFGLVGLGFRYLTSSPKTAEATAETAEAIIKAFMKR